MIDRELGKRLLDYLKDRGTEAELLRTDILIEMDFHEFAWVTADDIKYCDYYEDGIPITDEFVESVARKMSESYDSIFKNELDQAVEDTIEQYKAKQNDRPTT